LDFETNYYTRRFIDSFYIYSDEQSMNVKRSDLSSGSCCSGVQFIYIYTYMSFLLSTALDSWYYCTVVFNVWSFNWRTLPPGGHTFYSIRARISQHFVFRPDKDTCINYRNVGKFL